MNFAADLHSHTCVSDGVLAPEALVDSARQRGLEVLAISDHDTLGAYRTLAGKDLGLRLIPAVELSTDGPAGEIHVLGYFVDPESTELETELEKLRQARRRRVTRILAALAAEGIKLDLELAGEGSLGRPHVARALVRAGHARSIRDAFNRYLGTGKPGHVPYRNGLDPVGAIRLIRAARGVASLAHPDLAMAEGSELAELARAGLGAVETCHPRHAPAAAETLRKAAAALGLLTSGGSDFHGTGEEGAFLGDYGVTRGQLAALEERRAGT